MCSAFAHDLQVLDLVAQPIIVVDVHEGHTTYAHVNKALLGMTQTLDFYAGYRPTEVFPDRSGRLVMDRQLSIAADGGHGSYTVHRAIHGKIRLIEVHMRPMVVENGRATRMIGTVKLQSEHVSTAELEAEQFVIMAAHDLRAPMRNVQILTDLLRDGFEDHGDGKLELIEALERTGQKASNLIGEVLAYAQASHHKDQLLKTVSLAQLCGDIFSVLDPNEEHDLTSDEATLTTDSVALQIAVRNLVDNALRHGGRDHLGLKVSVAAHIDGFIELEVADNGRGLDEPDRAFLSGGDFRYGSGFGLLGLKRLVTSRGGTIHVDQPVDHTGTIVRLTLPGTIAETVRENAPVGLSSAAGAGYDHDPSLAT